MWGLEGGPPAFRSQPALLLTVIRTGSYPGRSHRGSQHATETLPAHRGRRAAPSPPGVPEKGLCQPQHEAVPSRPSQEV